MTRPTLPLHRAVAALLAALAFLLFLGVAAAQARPTYRGVQVHSLWPGVTDADMDRELDLVSGAGANVVRVDVGWDSLQEAGRGQYSSWYVAKLDRFVAHADSRGLKVIATLWRTPCWASSAPDSVKQSCAGAWWNRGVTLYPPSDPADYGTVARWMTSRYGTKLAALEVWNEPNFTDGRYFTSDHRVADYAALVKAAYAPAKAGNPDVPVLAGSMGYADTGFLTALYAQGIRGSYDGISIHPYADGRDPLDACASYCRDKTFVPGIQLMHDAQQAAGDTTSLWLTEFGWPSCSLQSCNSLTEQADYTRQAFQALDNLDYVKGATVYQLRDMSVDASDAESNFGLVRNDFSPRPAYEAFKAAMGAAPAPAGAGSQATAPGTPQTVGTPVTTGVKIVATTGGPDAAKSSVQIDARGRVSAVKKSKRARTSSKRLTLRVRRVNGVVVAQGSAPGRVVRLSVMRAGKSGWSVVRRVSARVSRGGRFSRAMGSLASLAKVRVTASAVTAPRAVSAAVRA